MVAALAIATLCSPTVPALKNQMLAVFALEKQGLNTPPPLRWLQGEPLELSDKTQI